MSEFYSILTTKGLAKVATLATGDVIRLTHMVFGNSTNIPFEDQTELGSEKHRCELIKVIAQENEISAEAILLGNVGGFWVREIGIIDEDGDLFAVGKFPATYKPDASEGTVKELGVRMVLKVTNAENTVVSYNIGIVDGAASTNLDNLTFAGQKKFNDKANLESPDLTGIPKTPTADSGTNTKQIASTAFVQAAISALINSAPGVLDTLEELAEALGNDPNFATTITNLITKKLDSEIFEEFEVIITNLVAGKASEEDLNALITAINGKANKTGDSITVATINPTEFSVRNIMAQTIDPGINSALANGNIILVYEN
jgi:phage-related tail fiber protein